MSPAPPASQPAPPLGGPVAVALSGGVDSALAAALLRDSGCELIGVTARLYPPGTGGTRDCCDEQMARALCAQLGIEYYPLDLTRPFDAEVIQPFIGAYACGLTPNPCLLCNRHIKFAALWDAARRLGAACLATGHYVSTGFRLGRPGIAAAADPTKDQTYMLALTPAEALAHVRFPLASLRKSEVVAQARARDLPFSPRESQDICFVPVSLPEFLAARLPLEPGPVLDHHGRQLGTHRGLPLYTVGQRPRIPGLAGERLYVIARDVARNALIVGPRAALSRREFRAGMANWISIAPPAPDEPFECLVRVRYRAPLIPATVRVAPGAGAFTVSLGPHDQAIAPGQGAALYDARGWLLGGGLILDQPPD